MHLTKHRLDFIVKQETQSIGQLALIQTKKSETEHRIFLNQFFDHSCRQQVALFQLIVMFALTEVFFITWL